MPILPWNSHSYFFNSVPAGMTSLTKIIGLKCTCFSFFLGLVCLTILDGFRRVFNRCWDNVDMGSIYTWIRTEQDVLLKTPLFRIWLSMNTTSCWRCFLGIISFECWDIKVNSDMSSCVLWHFIYRSYKCNSVGLKIDDTITFSVERYRSSTWDVIYFIRYMTIDNLS